MARDLANSGIFARISGAKNLLHGVSDPDLRAGDDAADPTAGRALPGQDVRVHRLGGLWGAADAPLDIRHGGAGKSHGASK